MQRATDMDFRRGVLVADARHCTRPLLWGQPIRHGFTIMMSDDQAMTDQAAADLTTLGADESVSFRMRACTIDHLGRGQIADAPTAVSELWKNAWDAYASQVSLNSSTAISRSRRSSTMASACQRPTSLRSGWLSAPNRKSMGRRRRRPPILSVHSAKGRARRASGVCRPAFLAPVTLVLSQQADGPISAVLVDWRLFENPFLALDQISLPVRTFNERAAVVSGLRSMADAILHNLGKRDKSGALVLSPEWTRYTAAESERGHRSTAQTIEDFWRTVPMEARHLENGPSLPIWRNTERRSICWGRITNYRYGSTRRMTTRRQRRSRAG